MDPEEARDPWRAPRGADPRPLADLLSRELRRRGWAQRLEEARVHELWPSIAGAQLAAHTEPVRLHGGVLVVRADSATWATQVRYLAGDVLRRANETLGDGQVHRLTVVTGALGGEPGDGRR